MPIGSGATIAVLSGPTFAKEIARDLPCGVALARRLHVAIPLSEAIDKVLNHGADLDATMARWMDIIQV